MNSRVYDGITSIARRVKDNIHGVLYLLRIYTCIYWKRFPSCGQCSGVQRVDFFEFCFHLLLLLFALALCSDLFDWHLIYAAVCVCVFVFVCFFLRYPIWFQITSNVRADAFVIIVDITQGGNVQTDLCSCFYPNGPFHGNLRTVIC